MNDSDKYWEEKSVLDEAYVLLQKLRSVPEGMELLFRELSRIRQQLKGEDWRTFCEDVCLAHPVRSLLHQDPVTYRSFSKPRGYAGDAELLDFLYRNPAAQEEKLRATSVGREICEYNISRPTADSVRWRRAHLARVIDEVAARVSHPEILSVACGYLREAYSSSAVREARLHRFVAFDQDQDSLARIEAEKNGCDIQCLLGSVRDLIRKKIKPGKFDLIYSAGLYDYLPEGAARLLTKILFEMLKVDGRLIIANFLPNVDAGYMEAFMGWELLYRTRHEFERVVALDKFIQKVYLDDNRYVVYIELRNWKTTSPNNQ